MTWKTVAIPTALVLVILVVGTLVEAHFTDRWVKMDSEKLNRFAEAISRVPKKIGDWEGKDDPISQAEFEATNCEAYVSRNYVNQRTGDSVSMYLVAGTARHVTIHTPDRCYRGSGFQQEGDVESYEMDLDNKLEEDPQFSTAAFSKPGQSQRVFWTYSDDGNWYGPGSSNIAKIRFGGRPALFKIYLIGPPDPPQENVANQFAKDVFPVINEILFSESGESTSGDVEADDLNVS